MCLISPETIRRSIAQPNGNLCSWRNLQSAFQSGCAILHSQQQCKRIQISPYSHPHLLLSDFLIPALLVAMKCYLMVLNQCPVLQVGDGGRKNWANQNTWRWVDNDWEYSQVISLLRAGPKLREKEIGKWVISPIEMGGIWGSNEVGLEIRSDFRISRESEQLRETEAEA